ncbi:uncharacterized protein LOC111364370 [Spodoptera litura]|uniref:Uncharacterized protein LOC111364370 n=1 Tax=Spodoptera litura TaxID=69820 RepID=A0A9J7EVG9_SPOLT|nr:uncharacterized protein LOC111364370 [Spodoptera litura]
MNQKAVIKLCKDLGCCDACCLRYLGLKNPTAYENVQQFVHKICEESGKHAQDTETRDLPTQLRESTAEQNSTHQCPEPPTKRIKVGGICVSCLGVLQEDNWQPCCDMVKEVLDKKGYECETFACALSAPIAALVRERLVALQLKHDLLEYDDSSVTPLKEAWKWSFGVRLAEHVGKTLDSGAVSPLLITLHMEYPDELQELEALKALAPALFEARRAAGRRFGVEFTRTQENVNERDNKHLSAYLIILEIPTGTVARTTATTTTTANKPAATQPRGEPNAPGTLMAAANEPGAKRRARRRRSKSWRAPPPPPPPQQTSQPQHSQRANQTPLAP